MPTRMAEMASVAVTVGDQTAGLERKIMARLNIIICDLCKGMSKVTLPYGMTLQSGKGKDREVTKAEICQKCYEDLSQRIQSDFDFNNSFSSRPRKDIKPAAELSPIDIIEIAKGENMVPSNIDNIAPPPQPKCLHGATSIIDDDGVTTQLKCRDCGEEWKAEL
jgi:hypothetical protein